MLFSGLQGSELMLAPLLPRHLRPWKCGELAQVTGQTARM